MIHGYNEGLIPTKHDQHSTALLKSLKSTDKFYRRCGELIDNVEKIYSVKVHTVVTDFLRPYDMRRLFIRLKNKCQDKDRMMLLLADGFTTGSNALLSRYSDPTVEDVEDLRRTDMSVLETLISANSNSGFIKIFNNLIKLNVGASANSDRVKYIKENIDHLVILVNKSFVYNTSIMRTIDPDYIIPYDGNVLTHNLRLRGVYNFTRIGSASTEKHKNITRSNTYSIKSINSFMNTYNKVGLEFKKLTGITVENLMFDDEPNMIETICNKIERCIK